MGTFNSFTPPSGIGYTFGSGGISGGTTSTGSTGSGGSFFSSSSGQNVISQGVSSLLSFGLQAFSSNQARQDLKAQSNIVAQQAQSQLATAQEGTKQAQIAYETAKLQSAGGGGGSTALYVGLGIAGVVVLGVVIYAVTKR